MEEIKLPVLRVPRKTKKKWKKQFGDKWKDKKYRFFYALAYRTMYERTNRYYSFIEQIYQQEFKNYPEFYEFAKHKQ